MKQKTLMEICTEFDISRRTIQGYEAEGLVKATGKTDRGYLLYDEQAINRIMDIKLYQKMGFTRCEIKNIIDASSETKKNALREKKQEVEKNLQELENLIIVMDSMINEL